MSCLLDIRKLRVQAGDGDGLSCRRRAERELAGVEVPSLQGLPDAVLCVRSMRAPLPAAIREGRHFSHNEALAKILDKFFQTAARPARGFVPASASAVVFADRAELLACLALDWLRGEIPERWWWRALFPRTHAADAVRQHWQAEARQVPEAMQRLDQAGQSAQFCRALPADVCDEITARVAAEFGVEKSARAIAQASRAAVALEKAVFAEARPDPPISVSGGQEIARPNPPWIAWLNVPPKLETESQALFVLSLMLAEAPAILRSERFTEQLENFVREYSWPQGEINSRRSTRLVSKTETTLTVDRGEILEPPRHAGLRSDHSPARDGISPPVPTEVPSPSSVPATLKASVRSSARASMPMGSDDFPSLDEIAPASPPVSSPPSPSFDSTRLETTIPKSADGLLPRELGRHATVITEFGGVFYLLNVALALELYGDFTKPKHPDLPLTLWDFLALLGRKMVGPEFVEDPCWDLLAALSRREITEPPGAWFDPPTEWRLPDSWMRPFPEKTGSRVRTQNGRLCLRHPAGFTVLDVANENELPGKIQCEEPRLGLVPENVRVDFPTNCAGKTSQSDECVGHEARLERWLTWLTDYFWARLGRAWAEPDRDKIRELVFPHRAQIACTAGRGDVYFSLAQHPLAVRLAGLDRDPGWVPAAGRVISFHYD
jgi:hypothetical protein